MGQSGVGALLEWRVSCAFTSTVGKTVVESESAGSFAPIPSPASPCAGLQGEQAPAPSPEGFHLAIVSCSRRLEGGREAPNVGAGWACAAGLSARLFALRFVDTLLALAQDNATELPRTVPQSSAPQCRITERVCARFEKNHRCAASASPAGLFPRPTWFGCESPGSVRKSSASASNSSTKRERRCRPLARPGSL